MSFHQSIQSSGETETESNGALADVYDQRRLDSSRSVPDDDGVQFSPQDDPQHGTLEATAAAPQVAHNVRSKMEVFEIELGQRVSEDIMADDEEDDDTHAISKNAVDSILRQQPAFDVDKNEPRSIEQAAAVPIAANLSEDEPNDMQSLLGCASNTDVEQEAGGSTATCGGTTGASSAAQLANSKSNSSRPLQTLCWPCGCRNNMETIAVVPNRMGNIRIPFPRVYAWTGGTYGVMGPHWFGPPCIIGIWSWASYYFIYTCSWRQERYTTAAIGIVLAGLTLYHLISAAYRDPGVIVKGRFVVPDPVPRTFRWCEICQNYQPPRAAHCPDCNVCIANFDHHCVWMSLCIGKGNFKVRYPYVMRKSGIGWTGGALTCSLHLSAALYEVQLVVAGIPTVRNRLG
jgi:DHHC palmitoyltransferase